MTALDRAYAAMQRGGEPEALAFWHILADAELFLVLEREAVGEGMTPRVFDLADGPLLLAFDSEERLAGFSAAPVPYAALPGRVVAGQLAVQRTGPKLGLGLNLGTGAPSEAILPAEAMAWLAQMLTQGDPEPTEARIVRLAAPHLPPGLLAALSGLLPVGVSAALAQADYGGGGRGHLLAVSRLAPPDEVRLARAVTEALAFSGFDAASLDLVFLDPQAALFGQIAVAGQVLEPVAQAAAVEAAAVVRQGPGTDPNRPPRLK